MRINKELLKKFEKYGWIVECESPLEIYHEETNSKATGVAAQIIIDDFDAICYNYFEEEV